MSARTNSIQCGFYATYDAVAFRILLTTLPVAWSRRFALLTDGDDLCFAESWRSLFAASPACRHLRRTKLRPDSSGPAPLQEQAPVMRRAGWPALMLAITGSRAAWFLGSRPTSRRCVSAAR